jgi:hypothetical protein
MKRQMSPFIILPPPPFAGAIWQILRYTWKCTWGVTPSQTNDILSQSSAERDIVCKRLDNFTVNRNKGLNLEEAFPDHLPKPPLLLAS